MCVLSPVPSSQGPPALLEPAEQPLRHWQLDDGVVRHRGHWVGGREVLSHLGLQA